MASGRSSVRSASPACSSLGTEDANLVIAAVGEAEAAARGNPSCSGSGGAPAPPVNPLDGHAPVNPPVNGDSPAAVCSALGQSLSNIVNDPRNKVPCSVRSEVMDVYFRMQRLVMSLSAGKSLAEGQVIQLRQQVDDLRGAGSSGGNGAAPPPAVERSPSFADVAGRQVPPSAAARRPSGVGDSRPDHALHLRLANPSPSPGKDIVALLKSSFNPSAIGVGPVTFKPSRAGLTVVSKVSAYLDNLETAIKSNSVTRSALVVQKPSRRNPQLKILGVDPSIVPAMLLSQINSQNDLAIPPEEFKHRTVYTQRFGARVHVVEVSPEVFALLKSKGRLHIGWTSCTLEENLYVPTCFRCSSLGHSTNHCEAPRDICNNCAGDHATSACTLAEHANYVCNECRMWKRPHNHFFGASTCTSVSAWVARLRRRTDYGDPQSSA